MLGHSGVPRQDRRKHLFEGYPAVNGCVHISVNLLLVRVLEQIPAVMLILLSL
ncbi:hypothetical protein J6590_045926 [Homalodisca vitripennis]|nr:hypothetical protein J6590_045926 [Homalodisca vitripennis]